MDEKEKSQENVAPEVQAEQVDSESKNNGVEADSEMTRKVIFSLCYLWGILFFITFVFGSRQYCFWHIDKSNLDF